MAQPTLLTQPFAANGDKNVIPNTTAVQGAFSQDKGFPAECSLPLGAGGVAPSRQDFNGAFNMLSQIAFYAQKGYFWHWDAGQEYFVGCVVIDETDGNMYQCIQNVAAGGSVPSADATNWKKFSTGGGKSVGELVLRAWGEANVGELLCDGAEVSRAMYPDYAQWSAEHGYPWGAGDGSTTVNLPNLIGKFPEGALTAGGYHEAGLPNIEGDGLFFAGASSKTTSGAIYKTSTATAQRGSGTSDVVPLAFDASRSNSIYGNSDTVQPASALLIPYVVVFTEQTADSALIDVTQYAQELANKINRSEADYVVDSYSDADGNWWRKYKSGWVEQGGGNTNVGSASIVNFLKPFADDAYTVNLTMYASGKGFNYQVEYNSKTTTSFKPLGYTTSGEKTSGYYINWSACGMGAEV